jgi:hypothetical protein
MTNHLEEDFEPTRLTLEMLQELGFEKISYIDEDTNLEMFHYELPLSKSIYVDMFLTTNANDEDDFPVVRFCGVNEYKFIYAEPLIVLLSILQASCVVEGFTITEQFKKNEDESK